MNQQPHIPPAPLAVRMTASGVTKRFDGRAAIEDVSFSVDAGEFVAVLGPSGAGKTTLFRCLTGLLAPDAGAVRIGGVDIAAVKGRARRRVAVVFQQFNLVSRLTALDNVLAGRLGHVPAWRGLLRRFSRADRLLALECLDRVGLLDKALQRADTLSGGQQQRCAIARALAQRPDLIVADEPVASLDPAASAGVLELLRGIARSEGVGIVCSLHQVPYARAYADRIVGLSHGRLVTDVPAARFDEAAFAALYGAEAGAGKF
ncbi:phosphonate ABC transporter ATP-binding protein [Xanthobacter tagetidis]|uniref:Phosphonate ABC transporter ATP-binding protein n=1 Tax=Xanthobacter tagetidis TaxID=60216 RepID=A0A3L7A757_9HYPH|nr:phosphonate ABC transporter ATP-binding protein [Xanthobacter tagetidis]RLP75192.1 phosphonate ABC transporter ATP-binding protein [Xanthobacter tagetidis]